MPALPWEIAQAEEEGVKIIPSFGPDRLLLNDGRVTGLQAKRCVSVFDDACRFAPTFDESITVTVPADEIMLAIGQRPESIVLQDLDLTRGYIAADDQTGATSLPGVYAAGDSVTGPATVVAAMAGGRRLAEAINKQLSAASPLGLGVEPAATTQAEPGLNAFHVPGLAPSPAARPTEAPATERTIDAEDAPEGLSPNLVVAEATRCFNCGCVAVSPSDLAAALVALDATVVTTAREIPAGAFFAAGEATSTILESAELVREIRVPRCAEGTRSAYLKFRIREAIDFPVAAAAVRIVLDGRAVQDARVVLGAAAPYPVRAHAAEDYLRGKTLSHETAERAAGLALQGSIALAQNDYKLQILKAMVRRALLACA
jgi:CO/xanthine dehydrogenase FAD-binding subunit